MWSAFLGNREDSERSTFGEAASQSSTLEMVKLTMSIRNPSQVGGRIQSAGEIWEVIAYK